MLLQCALFHVRTNRPNVYVRDTFEPVILASYTHTHTRTHTHAHTRTHTHAHTARKSVTRSSLFSSVLLFDRIDFRRQASTEPNNNDDNDDNNNDHDDNDDNGGGTADSQPANPHDCAHTPHMPSPSPHTLACTSVELHHRHRAGRPAYGTVTNVQHRVLRRRTRTVAVILRGLLANPRPVVQLGSMPAPRLRRSVVQYPAGVG